MEGKVSLGRYLIWVLILMGQLHGYKSCIEKERDALLNLKKYIVSIKVKEESNFFLNTWTNDTNSDCCRWEGVKCNRTTRRVISLSTGELSTDSQLNLSLLHPFEEVRSLNLSGFGFSGLFDDVEGYESLRRLRNLEILDLSSNYFNNSIFPFLNAATSLTTLLLKGNNLDGPFPVKELKDLTNLEDLDLSENRFNGSVPIQDYESLRRLRHLEILDLSYNEFNSMIFPFLNAATSLRTLFIRGNYMGGSLPAKELKNLTKLELLDLSACSFNGSMPEFTHLEKLKVLYLGGNDFSSPMELQGKLLLKNLYCYGDEYSFFDFPNNHFSSSYHSYILLDSLSGLKNLTKLETLDLRGCGFNGSMPEFTHLEKLKALYLGGNDFSSSVELEELKILTNLEILSLAWNSYHGQIPIKVFCEMKNLRQLDLSGNYFSGQLPPCSGSGGLNKLQALDLSSNELSGNLPYSFSSLESLEYLSLSDNNFEGFFSLNPLYNLTNLKVFKLSSTSDMVQVETETTWLPKFQLTVVELPFCSLEKIRDFLIYQQNLRLVDLSSNRISGDIPAWLLGNNPELKVLQLKNNSFNSFQIPTIVHKLHVLDFSANDISGGLPDNIGHVLSSLLHMNGSHSGIQGNLPSSMGEMKNISFLDLSYNNFSGELPTSLFTGCFSLRSLFLSHNRFSGHILPLETGLTSLIVLRMNNNLFTGEIGVGLLTLGNLSIFDASDNRLTGAIPSSWSESSHLIMLLLSNNLLEGTLPPSLLAIHHLNYLDLSGNLLSGDLPASDVNSMYGIKLFLSNNSFTGPLPGMLLKNAKIVDLRNNKLSGSIPQFVSNMNMRIFLLRGNNLTGSIPEKLCDLTSVRLLDLSDNKLNGVIPSCLYNLSTELGQEEPLSDFSVAISFGDSFEMEYYRSGLWVDVFWLSYDDVSLSVQIEFAAKQRYDSYNGGALDYMYGLDLSSNELSGIIPAELGDLSKLRTLNLSRNLLLGSIPASFSKLKDIESLDLSYNRLQGSIPHQLTNLTSLAVFNVSFNNLSGIIPQGGQFNTFNDNSYIGNPLLCGPPTDRSCEDKNSKETDNGGEEDDDEADIDMLVFYWTTGSTYVIALIGVLVLMCFDSCWRRAWLRLVDTFISSAKSMMS